MPVADTPQLTPMSQSPTSSSSARVPIAGLLAWLVPGLGHLCIGLHARGLIFLVVITATFWGGIAIGGVKSTVGQRRWWLMAQMCAGSHALAAWSWGRSLPELSREEPSPYRAVWPADDVAVVYTGVAGMLNLLVIFDVLVRAERAGAPQAHTRSPPGRLSG